MKPIAAMLSESPDGFRAVQTDIDDKLSMAPALLGNGFNLHVNKKADLDQIMHVGDTPNDFRMFAFFPLSGEVANLRYFAEQLAAEPAFVTDARASDGFAELVDLLVRA